MNAQSATRRRIGIGLVVVCAALLSSSCAAGQQAQTANEKPAIDGTSGGIDALQLHAVAIKAAPGAPSYQSGDAAELQVVVVNTGHAGDTLQSVSSPAISDFRVFATPADASAAVSPPASSTSAGAVSPASQPASTGSASTGNASPGSASTAPSTATTASPSTSTGAGPSLAIPAGQALSLSVVTTDAVLLVHLTRALFSGMSVPITFTFANAGSVTLVVPVKLTEPTAPVGVTVPPPSVSSGS